MSQGVLVYVGFFWGGGPLPIILSMCSEWSPICYFIKERSHRERIYPRFFLIFFSSLTVKANCHILLQTFKEKKGILIVPNN